MYGPLTRPVRLPHHTVEHAGVRTHNCRGGVAHGLQLGVDSPVHQGAVAIRDLGGSLCGVSGNDAWLGGGSGYGKDEGFEVGRREGLGGGERCVARKEDVVVLELGFLGDGGVEYIF